MPPGISDKDYVIAQYDGAIAYMDACIQSIFTALEAHGIYDETIVVLNGDHGETLYDHEAIHYVGSLSLFDRIRLLKDAKTSLRRFPTRYEGGLWECTDSNKLFAVQVLHSKKTEGLWDEVTDRCVCH